MVRWLLPDGVDPEASLLLVARALRALGDGYMAVLMPAYLLAIGLDTLQVGIVSTATMLGSALTTLAVVAWGHRFASNRLLPGAAVLMAVTGWASRAYPRFGRSWSRPINPYFCVFANSADCSLTTFSTSSV
jgi:hypothetical protein